MEYRQGCILNKEVRDCLSEKVVTGQRLEVGEGRSKFQQIEL